MTPTQPMRVQGIARNVSEEIAAREPTSRRSMVEIFSSKELGSGWRVSIARDDAGWRVDDFLNHSGANRTRVVPPEPVTAVRHPSLELALHAARRWLHAERLF